MPATQAQSKSHLGVQAALCWPGGSAHNKGAFFRVAVSAALAVLHAKLVGASGKTIRTFLPIATACTTHVPSYLAAVPMDALMTERCSHQNPGRWCPWKSA